jgi:HTH-type transcriptional regulator/antitoxin HipB
VTGPIIGGMPESFDLSGTLRRIRRRADMSQRELAEAAGISASAVAHAEAGTRDLPVTALARAATAAGLRVALLEQDGAEVAGMRPDAVRDRGGRRFPAHLDPVLSEERRWRWDERPRLSRPTYTFDRRRPGERPTDRHERPTDHLRPMPGDSPQDRTAARQRAAWRRREEERQRRREAGELPPRQELECTCPASCDALEDWAGRPVHDEECPCQCDVG